MSSDGNISIIPRARCRKSCLLIGLQKELIYYILYLFYNQTKYLTYPLTVFIKCNVNNSIRMFREYFDNVLVCE